MIPAAPTRLALVRVALLFAVPLAICAPLAAEAQKAEKRTGIRWAALNCIGDPG
jgi:hypothetical protein